MTNKRQRKKRQKREACALCGKPLPVGQGRKVVGRTGRGVCARCIDVARRLLVEPEDARVPIHPGILTPQQIIHELDQKIIGQRQAKRAVSVALWKQQLRARGIDLPNPGLLMCGPTGCGKTALAREAARIAGLPFMVFDTTTLSETGYKGRDASEMIRDMKKRFGARAAHGVVFLDELDKLAATAGNDHRASYNRGTQATLLKLIEGAEVEGLSTAGMLFLFAGAFSGLRKEHKTRICPIGFDRTEEEDTEERLCTDDLIGYGMEPELMGRIQRCVFLEELTADDLRDILLHSDLSVFRKYQAFFQSRGSEITLDDEATDILIHTALSRGLGARGLNGLVEEWVEPKLLELAEDSP